MREHVQEEVAFLGFRSSPSFIAEPECHGVAERYVRTLDEQVVCVDSSHRPCAP